MQSWVVPFYTFQSGWTGLGEVGPQDMARLEAIHRHAGSGPHRILELGAGGGQSAFLAATLGHRVTAVELVTERADHARALAKRAQTLRVIEGSFDRVELPEPFDLVVYWDGFGVGDDGDQRQLLRRISEWLSPNGVAIIDIYSPWYAASVQGQSTSFDGAERRYGFDPEGNRWLDTWWPTGQPEFAIAQSLRCYAPADLQLLLEGTGLELASFEPGPGPDARGSWLPRTELHRCMSWQAKLERV